MVKPMFPVAIQVKHEEGHDDLHSDWPPKACHRTWRLRAGETDKSDWNEQSRDQAAKYEQTDVARPSFPGFYGITTPRADPFKQQQQSDRRKKCNLKLRIELFDHDVAAI